MYKLKNQYMAGQVIGLVVVCQNENNTTTSFITDPANTDYQTFRKDVAGGVELQDADGNVMTQAQVDDFLKTIPE